MVAMTLFRKEKCCHLMSAHKAYPRCMCCSVFQFLIYSTFIFVRYFQCRTLSSMYLLVDGVDMLTGSGGEDCC